MSRTRVMVEVNPATGQILRIFKHAKNAYALEPERVKQLPRSEAVGTIRHAIWLRTKGLCEYCGRAVSENSWPNKFEMHEEVPRSRGGEISLDNSKGLCKKCHVEVTGDIQFGQTVESEAVDSLEEILESTENG